jgi:D-arabinose 1-dehydrogenase-like Zn-dependent alcohol dehydrogenase
MLVYRMISVSDWLRIGSSADAGHHLHRAERHWQHRRHYNDLAELMALAQSGMVTLHTRTYPLDAAPEALADLDAGRVRGRAILVP